jgi:hypothetical protein
LNGSIATYRNRVARLAFIFGGAVLGHAISMIIPESYTNEKIRDAAEPVMNTISLLSALVLGLLTVTAKSNFDARTESVEQFAANLRLLDREIHNFNPPIEGLRDQLRQYTSQMILVIWPQPNANNRGVYGDGQDLNSLEDIVRKIRKYAPRPKNRDWYRLAH